MDEFFAGSSNCLVGVRGTGSNVHVQLWPGWMLVILNWIQLHHLYLLVSTALKWPTINQGQLKTLKLLCPLMDMLTRFLCGKYATGSTFPLNPPSTGIGEDDSTDPRTGKYLTRMQLTYPRFITLLTYYYTWSFSYSCTEYIYRRISCYIAGLATVITYTT